MTKIKICGLTNEADVSEAVRLGADFLGFIHVPHSRRYLGRQDLENLLPFARRQASEGVKTVVVVQDADESTLAAMRDKLDFDWFQFHGSESRETVNRWGGFKVFHVRDSMAGIGNEHYGSPFMLDTAKGNRRGGTGEAFDWSILKRIDGDFFVAGGLNPENVGQLVLHYRPWGVDVSSGVEIEPGRKDHGKMARFFEETRREPI